MKIGYVFVALLILILIGTCSSGVTLAGNPEKWTGGIDDDEKFLVLRTKLQGKLKDVERSKVNFAIGEYFYKINDLIDAGKTFKEFTEKNTAGISSLLANAYLYKLAAAKNDEEDMMRFKKEMFRDQFILLFDKFKTLNYTSLYGNTYEVHYFVDRIEIFLNGASFEKVSP